MSLLRHFDPPELEPADVLLVMPPFGGVDRPSIGLHLLQACAKSAGFRVTVVYANLLLASEMGYGLYEAISYAPTSDLLGEKLFSTVFRSRSEFRESSTSPAVRTSSVRNPLRDQSISAHELAEELDDWVERICDRLVTYEASVIGFTSTFEQTACASRLIRGVKRRRPDLTTLIGGANCEGEMAKGVAALIPEVDYIFSGESETTFIDFLNSTRSGRSFGTRIFQGEPCKNLDGTKTPLYVLRN